MFISFLAPDAKVEGTALTGTQAREHLAAFVAHLQKAGVTQAKKLIEETLTIADVAQSQSALAASMASNRGCTKPKIFSPQVPHRYKNRAARSF